MATSTRPQSDRQSTLPEWDTEGFDRPDHGSLDYELGDLLEDKGQGRSTKLILVECPLCASDAGRPRYHFGTHESRPAHFVEEHSEDRGLFEFDTE